jgi:hypothetical protein
VLALRAWARANDELGRPGRAAALRAEADAIANAIRDILYDRSTGLIAEHLFDDGVKGGTPADFWAHTQIWAALAEISPEDSRGLDRVAERCLDRGVFIAPESAFEQDYVAASTDSAADLPIESTATWLLARWPEVTHLFSLAQIESGNTELALDAVRQQLPEVLHAADTRCAPHYYAEKYLYPGTRPWLCTWAGDPSLIEVLIAGFLGVTPTSRGITIAPALPAAWSGAAGIVRLVARETELEIELSPEIPEGSAEIDADFVRLPVTVQPRPGSRMRVRVSTVV